MTRTSGSRRRTTRFMLVIALIATFIVFGDAVRSDTGRAPRVNVRTTLARLPAVAGAAGLEAAERAPAAPLPTNALPLVEPVVRPAATFRMAAVSVPGDDVDGAGLLVIRSRLGTGRWSDWQPVDFTGDEGPDTPAPPDKGWAWSLPVWTDDADAVQVHRLPGPLAAATTVRVHTYEIPRWNPSQRAGVASAMTDQPGIVSRAQWGANESIRRAAPSYAAAVRMAFVHHTVNSNTYGVDEADDLIRGIYAYHVQSRGWDDIGYNFIVDRFGRTFEGRFGGIDKPVIGAHAEGFNNGSTGVAVLGDHTSSPPSASAMDALKRFLAWKLDVHHVDPQATISVVSGGSPKFGSGQVVSLRTISGHRDTGDTSCPGQTLYDRLAQLRVDVGALGRPKVFDPAPLFTGGIQGSPVGVSARFSEGVSWSWTLRNSGGATVATRSGSGTSANPVWDGKVNGAPAPSGTYTWTLSGSSSAGTTRPATGVIRVVARHPDGAILKSPSSPTVWVIRDGARWPVINESAFLSQAGPAEIATVGDSILNAYPRAGAGWRDGALIKTPDNRVFVISDRARRWITTGETFVALGYQWSAIRAVTTTDAAVHPEGAQVTTPGVIPNGTFVKKASSNAVYRVVGGAARSVPDQSVLDSYRVAPNEIAVISDAQLVTLGGGSGVVGYRDGTLIRTSDGKVWAVSDGARRWITSGTVFSQLGYRFESVLAVNPTQAGYHPQGANISGAVHPAGALVKSAGGPTIWLVRDRARWPVVSGDAYVSQASFGEVATASDAILGQHPVRSLGWRDGSLLRSGDGRIWVVSDGLRRWITSQGAFEGRGYSYDNVRGVSDVDLLVHPEGAPVSDAAALPNGLFVKRPQAATIYRMVGGTARPVISWNAFVSHRAALGEVVPITLTDFNALTLGSAFGFRDGTLIRTSDAKIWAVAGGAKRWITSGEAFTALGYDWSDVIQVTAEEANVHPNGANIS